MQRESEHEHDTYEMGEEEKAKWKARSVRDFHDNSAGRMRASVLDLERRLSFLESSGVWFDEIY